KSWRLLIGPWNHGGVQQVRYCRETRFLQFPKAQAVNEFLQHHLCKQKKASPPEWLASDQAEAHFYVCGAKPAWQHSTSWPPQNVAKRPLWLSKSGLSWTHPETAESDE
ncbi:Ank2, partial [Symbiodinium sp. KB8]